MTYALHKTNSKQIVEQIVKCEAIKFLEENIRKKTMCH